MIKNLIVALAKAFNEDLNLERLRIYCEMLKNLNEDKLKVVCKNIINTKTKFPMIAEIKEEYYKLENGNELASQEWSEVLDAVRKYGYYQQDKILGALKPLTREVVSRLGLERLCLMESAQVGIEKRMFIDTYNDFKASKKRDYVTNSFLLEESKDVRKIN